MLTKNITVITLSDSDSECENSSKCSIIEPKIEVIDVDSETGNDKNEIINLNDTVKSCEGSSCSFEINRMPDYIPINKSNDIIPPNMKLKKKPWKKTKSLLSMNYEEQVMKKKKNNKLKNIERPKSENETINYLRQLRDARVLKKKLRQKNSRVIQLSHTNILNTAEVHNTYGLRPIVIDGCNVAYGYGLGEYDERGIIHVIQYFKNRGHEEIVCFLPQSYKIRSRLPDIQNVISRFEKENIITYTPSRTVDGVKITPYDDRFVVQYASERGGVIISNDGYADLINEEPTWRTTIQNRIVNFTFARGILMLPKDPLGPCGPTLDEVLRFSE